MTPSEYAIKEGFTGEAERKKRLGQYFTGSKLSNLLAAIADCHKAKTIIDPMVGDGDLLQGCLDQGAHPNILSGIEIDPISFSRCNERFKNCLTSNNFIHANCFDPKVITSLPTNKFDLVITNPAYVRYQSLKANAGLNCSLPNALEVRSGLISSLQSNQDLTEQDRELFLDLAKTYSGLADLAVPSWIYCASLVKTNGTLAIVLPQTWLNREYALNILNLLSRCFEIKYIVEDGNANWFTEALVKTTLLVAKRVPCKKSFSVSENNSELLRITLFSQASSIDSLVGNVSCLQKKDEQNFSHLLKSLHNNKTTLRNNDFHAKWESHNHFFKLLNNPSIRNPQINDPESNQTAENIRNKYLLPSDIETTFREFFVVRGFNAIEEYGVRVGQGLRTGANKFFYADLIEKSCTHVVLQPNSIFGIKKFMMPADATLHILRNQSELPDAFRIRPSDLKGRVLVLQKYCLADDKNNDITKSSSAYKTAPKGLSKLIKVAENTKIKTSSDWIKIPNLSAVITNKRNATDKNPPRYWYMLPPMAKRHRPDVFMPRINNNSPRTYLNTASRACIDANFATFWLEKDASIDRFALLSFLNSSWCQLILEKTATVMGGGALKVEAAHLRRLPVPNLTSRQWDKLSSLGKELSNSKKKEQDGVLRKINSYLLACLMGKKNLSRAKDLVSTLLADVIFERRR